MINYNPTIEKFAPVLIPTLCRDVHFRNCLESLMKCTYADKTDVYIALDYPAKDKHWEGYIKICDYLEKIKLTHGFKTLNVIKRNRNYGFGEKGNLSQLREYVFTFNDTVIVSEDDNIFAPAFLDFMNKGLTVFANDPKVFAINGYRHFYDIKIKTNSFFRQNVDFSAWGYGIWKEKYNNASIILSNKRNLIRKAFNPISWFRLYKSGLNRSLNYISMLLKTGYSLRDTTYSIYMILFGTHVIMPSITLVKNLGWDNSGEHCKDNLYLAKKHKEQYLDNRINFQFTGTGYEYFKENQRIYKLQSYARIGYVEFIKRILQYCKKVKLT